MIKAECDRLPVLSALCVTPINLSAPPSSLPSLCSIIDTIERSWAAEVGGAQVSGHHRAFALPSKQEMDSQVISTGASDAEKTIKMDIIL